MQTSIYLSELDPFTNYSVLVIAVGEGGLEGQDSEGESRTHAATDTPPTTDPSATSDPGRNTLCVTLPDPEQIDTGPVMYVPPLHTPKRILITPPPHPLSPPP